MDDEWWVEGAGWRQGRTWGKYLRQAHAAEHLQGSWGPFLAFLMSANHHGCFIVSVIDVDVLVLISFLVMIEVPRFGQ
jgi:hypothetical protein